MTKISRVAIYAAIGLVGVLSFSIFFSNVAVADEQSDNEALLYQIHNDLNQIDTLIKAYYKGTVTIWPGYEIEMPIAFKNQIKQAAAAARASARANLLLLTLE
jgi:hypothetical protein